MKRLRFTEEQIIGLLKERKPARRLAVSATRGYRSRLLQCKAKSGGMEALDARKLKAQPGN